MADAAAPAPESPASPGMMSEQAAGMPAPMQPPAPPSDVAATGADKAQVQQPPALRPEKPQQAAEVSPLAQLLIYTAQLTLSVLELDKSLEAVETIARDLGGMLAQRTDSQAVIRVPTAKFNDALTRLQALGDLLHKSVEVQDVGEEFRDLSLRLQNARQVRDRLAALLANAKSVEESLKVERELERLNAEIQRMEGRLKYLRDRAAFSTITITFEVRQVEVMRRRDAFLLPFSWLSNLGLGRLLQLH